MVHGDKFALNHFFVILNPEWLLNICYNDVAKYVVEKRRMHLYGYKQKNAKC